MTAVVASCGYDTCGATTRGGGQCRRPAGWGTDHAGVGTCKLHLGCTESHTTHARLQLAQREAERSLADFGYEPVEDPLAKLADLASQASAIVDYWAAHVPDLDEVRYKSDKGLEQLRSEVVLYERAMDRAQKFLKDLVQLGFEERRTSVLESQGRWMADVLVAFADLLLAEDLSALDVVRRERVPVLAQQAIETTAA